MDNVIVIPFDRAFSALSGEEFADDYLIGKVGAETLVAGYNHRFGHDRIDCDALAASGRLREGGSVQGRRRACQFDRDPPAAG